MKCRGLKFPDDDAAYEHFRQRDIDDAAEVQRALFAGMEAGRDDARAGMNPHETGSATYAAWERGRSSIEAQRLSAELAKRPRLSCTPCTCGGRGLCLADAA